MEEAKRQIVEAILELEVDMFLRVPTDEEPSCRAHMEDMKLHRRGQFAGWSTETCASYLDDLRHAAAEGRNLMTLKYARMDKLIPPLSENPLIASICDRTVSWQREVLERYPNALRGAREIGDFANYLSCELETYSDRTLGLLWQDVERCETEGGNMAQLVYELLAAQSGFGSLGEMEQSFAG
jgi:hypothetical protein